MVARRRGWGGGGGGEDEGAVEEGEAEEADDDARRMAGLGQNLAGPVVVGLRMQAYRLGSMGRLVFLLPPLLANVTTSCSGSSGGSC